MRSQTYRTKLWNLTYCFILALLFGLNLTEGIRWINIPSQINKCPGQTANFTWEYVKEADEEIRQLQWRLNTTTLIAYRSDKNGLHIDPKYEGRVEKIGSTGILLKNVSSKDIGNYTLYLIIAWKESQITQSIWLNVIEVTIQQWCTCERLPISPEWSGGQTFSIVSDGCNLEINSSFCCIKGPAIECMENDPQKLCLPIRDQIILTESTTQSRIVPEQTAPTDVQKGDNVLVTAEWYLKVHTIMLCFLFTCSLFWIQQKICQDCYRRKRTQAVDSSIELLRTNKDKDLEDCVTYLNNDHGVRPTSDDNSEMDM